MYYCWIFDSLILCNVLVFNRSTNDNLMNSTNVVFGSEHGFTHVSQDELVIRQRGLSKTPLIFSPDIDVTKQVITNSLHFMC